MTFEELIIKEAIANGIVIANLYPQAKIASETPDLGITIKNKAAYFVIRDCAKVAYECLPITCYGLLGNATEKLKGKVTKKQLQDFLKTAEKNMPAKQLLQIIKDDANVPPESSLIIEEDSVDYLAIEKTSKNPYGEYGYSNTDTIDKTKEPKQTILDILVKIFDAK